MSARAIQVLSKVDLVAAEDTRHTGRLLSHFGLKTPLLAVHDHNEQSQTEAILARLLAGESIALVSDAGTPLVSDPGYRLVAAAAAAAIEVVSIPGPSAVVAALSIAGLPTDRFVFEGFLPSSAERRKTKIVEFVEESRTIVIFESVHRVRATISALAEALGQARRAAICRELTKRHEEVVRGSLGELQTADFTVKGEFVIVIEGAKDIVPGEAEASRLLDILLQELSVKSAAKIASQITGISRNTLYRQALAKKSD